MTALAITGVTPAPVADANLRAAIWGATVTVGRALVLDTATGKYSHADSGTADAAKVSAVAMSGGLVDVGGTIVTSGNITITGATGIVGMTYYLGAAGVIKPEADLTTGEYVTRIGICKSSGVIELDFKATGVVHA